jgi:hypothetical protein
MKASLITFIQKKTRPNQTTGSKVTDFLTKIGRYFRANCMVLKQRFQSGSSGP